MARRRQGTARKPVPAWLLGSWGNWQGEAAAWCRANRINPLTVLRFRILRRAARRLDADAPYPIEFTRDELTEVASWDIEETDG